VNGISLSSLVKKKFGSNPEKSGNSGHSAAQARVRAAPRRRDCLPSTLHTSAPGRVRHLADSYHSSASWA